MIFTRNLKARFKREIPSTYRSNPNFEDAEDDTLLQVVVDLLI